MKLMLGEAVPLMRFVLEAEISRHRLDTPEGKAKAVRSAAQVLSLEPSRVARGEHAFWVARRIGVDELEVQREIAEGSVRTEAGAPVTELRRPGHVKLEREALALLIDSPSRLGEVKSWINEDYFAVPEHRVLMHALISTGTQTQGRSLMDRLPDDATRRLAAELSLTPMTTDDPDEILERLEEFRLRRQIDSLRATLDRLDPGADAEKYDALFKELMQLEERRRHLDRD
jgi:DNA primase